MEHFYKLPLDFSTLMEDNGKQLEQCGEIESIDSYLELMIKTCPGEHKFDPNWGCKIWEMDFERVTSKTKWEAQCVSILTEMVRNYELRLADVAVQVKVRELTKEQSIFRTPAIKKRVDITIKGILASTGESCGFYYKMYMGPICTE